MIALGNSPDANFRPEVTGAPAIEVEEALFDLGDIRFNVMADVTYVIRNVGDQTLRITDPPFVEIVEGC